MTATLQADAADPAVPSPAVPSAALAATTLPRIFVNAASYRDREMQWTLRDMFEQAAHPDRVFAGICWQTVPEQDADCFVVRPRPSQVREDFVHADQALGLGWARARSQALWQGEEYCLQIDSHMRFAPGWDDSMLALLAQCDAPEPVLTHYPASYVPPDDLGTPTPPGVQMIQRFLPDGHQLQFTTRAPPPGAAGGKPLATAACAGGFIFGPARMLADVPADPEIYFQGEEPNLAVRLWTAGFDLFSPQTTVIYHYYLRRDGSRHWNDQPSAAVLALGEKTKRRMRALCNPAGAPPEEVAALGRHGLGQRRTLADYEAFAGVNFAGRTIADSATRYPWVRTPERQAAFQLDGLVRTPGSALFVLDDSGVILVKSTGRIHRANEAATYVWCALEQGWGWPQIARTMAENRGIAQGVMAAELRELADHWLGSGLLQRPDADPPADAAPLPRLDTRQHDLRTHHYRLLDTRFQVRFGGPALDSLLGAALAHLEVTAVADLATAAAEPPAKPDHRLDAISLAGWHYLFCDDAPLHHGQAVEALLPILKSALLVRATQADGHKLHLLHLHSAAVAIQGRLVLLPGRSGSGKTLLTAKLLLGGAQYFSDETALLSRNGGTVRPVPTALSVKAGGAVRLAGLYPALADLPLHLREDKLSVQYLPPPAGSVAADVPAVPRLCIFPRYLPGAATTLRRLSPVDAFARLLDEAIAVPAKLDADTVATLVQLAEQLPCWDMTSSDLDDAAAQVTAAALALPVWAAPAGRPMRA